MVLDKDTQLQAIACFGDREGPLFQDQLTVRNDVEAISLLTSPHPSYVYDGAVTLVDGFQGDDNFKSGRWLGYCDDNLVALLTLRETREVSRLFYRTNVQTPDWIFDVKALKLELSEDGETFTTVIDETYPSMTRTADEIQTPHEVRFPAQQAKYARVTISPETVIPDWHQGRGQRGFVFVDEIVID